MSNRPLFARTPALPPLSRLAMRRLLASALAAMACTAPSLAIAAVLAGWDVHSLTGGTNNFGASPFAASTAATNITVGGLIRGSGVVTTGTAAARGWGGTDWVATSAAAAATAGDVVSFTVAANAGYKVSISGISRLDYRRSSAGPASGVLQYQLGSGAFTDAANLSFTSTASAGASVAAIDLSGVAALQNVPAGTTITFRVVNYGATSAGGTWYLFDMANTTAADLEVSGTAVPAGPAVDGACGTANGLTYPVAPAANLCSSGGASAVTPGTGTWGWTCSGTNGGQAAMCSALSSAASGC
jgi:hypothetical protein